MQTAEKYEVAEFNETSPAAVMMAAINKGTDLDKLEKFMELQERWEINEARKAYHEAMAAFKANPPDILKDKHVQFQTQKGPTEYHHASLANVASSIGKALSDHGLSAAWKTEQGQGGITVTCTVTHRLGHSESTSLTAGPDNTGNKNAIQAVASTISYLERYTILALTGLATREMDDDGRAADPPEFITEKQVKEIEGLIKSTKSDIPKFLKFMGAETVDTILAKDYQKAIVNLNAKAAKANKTPEREPGSDDDK